MTKQKHLLENKPKKLIKIQVKGIAT